MTVTLGLIIFSIIIGISLLGATLSCAIAFFTIRPKLDKEFGKLSAGIFDPCLPFISSLFYRPFAYMASIAIGKKFSKNIKLGYFYGDYDFSGHANKFDITLSWIFIYLFIIPAGVSPFIFGLFYTLAKLMGIPTDF